MALLRVIKEKWNLQLISYQLVQLISFYLSNIFYISEKITRHTIELFKKCLIINREFRLTSIFTRLANIFNHSTNSNIKKKSIQHAIDYLNRLKLLFSSSINSSFNLILFLTQTHFKFNFFTLKCCFYLHSYFERVQSNNLFLLSSYEVCEFFSFKVQDFINRKYLLLFLTHFYKQLFKYSMLIFILVFKLHIVNCQKDSMFLPATSRNIDIDKLIDFDQGMFNELNMMDVLQSVYLSCYKEKLDDLKTKYLKNHLTNSIHQIDLNRLPKYILFELINSEHKILPFQSFKFIESMCKSNNDYDLLDKLYSLNEFEHETCGKIFRNSMKYSHLLSYVLDYKQTSNHQESKSFNIKKKKSYGNSGIHSRNGERIQKRSYFNETREVFTIDLEQFVSTVSDNFNYKSYLKKNEDDDHISSAPAYEYNQSDDDSVLSLAVSVVPKVAVNQKTSTDQSRTKNTHQIYVNNCTLSLLKIYLLAVKSKCDYDEFQVNLNQFDCYSDTFSVRSNCTLCAEAYRKWACSSNIPYYIKDKLAKPCMRYCFKVQNLCPFFRPSLTDSYGGQPVFHCRNVVQASEARIDGFEDDDENYYDDDKNDEDHCYEECEEPTTSPHLNRTEIEMDLDIIFRKESNILHSLVNNASLDVKLETAIKKWSIKEAWLARKSYNFTRLIESEDSSFSIGRFHQANECLFNSISKAVSNRTSRLGWLNLILNGFMIFCFLFEIV